MAPRYRIRARDTAGAILSEFTHFRSLAYRHEVDGPGHVSLTVQGDHAVVPLLTTDCQIEILREDADNSLGWYLEWAGLFRCLSKTQDENGIRSALINAVGYAELLDRRVVAWYQGGAGAAKYGVAETVLKEYADENAGPGATLLAGRLADGVTAGLTIQADAGGGPIWQGDLGFQNLLEALRKVATVSGWRFDVVGTGPAAFEFRTYETQRGADRTRAGMNTATGLNGAGNPPVVFMPEMGTVRTAEYTVDRRTERTVAIVLGRGEADNRDVAVVTVAAAAASPWNKRELVRNASNETDVAALTTIGDGMLEEAQAQETLDLEAIQIPGLLYGRDYTWGDRVVVRYEGAETTKEIVAVDVTVDDSGESVQPSFGDVP